MEQLPQGIVEVRETHGGDFEMRVRAGAHTLIADEPRALGGNDFGPGPYDLLLAALGTCTAMTLRLYARRKNLKLRDVHVRLSHERVHVEDAGREPMPSLERITRQIHLDGDLSDAEAARLMEIADRCPVHRTLSGTIKIETTQLSV
ncbi:MAG: OsmC family protein [Alphaproteobacteria bacterium]|nr:OsmC family protein [Alphaproteobacteria bacterium]